MLNELCGYLKNWFETDKYIGDFEIKDGLIKVASARTKVPYLQDNQYFRIVGSVFNDGVYQYKADTPSTELVDEKFHGAVWALAIPKEVIALNKEIDDWQDKYGASSLSPFASESLSASGYSYSRSSSGAGGSATITWKNIFSDKLRRWQKI